LLRAFYRFYSQRFYRRFTFYYLLIASQRLERVLELGHGRAGFLLSLDCFAAAASWIVASISPLIFLLSLDCLMLRDFSKLQHMTPQPQVAFYYLLIASQERAKARWCAAHTGLSTIS
jgi:hypothetical protein